MISTRTASPAARSGSNDLGPVLGSYHPAVAYNVRRLREISGQDEVSFHMSGTEAVMQAVRLARYHTGRSHLVRFCGAYHGWWGDVQPGIGNPSPADGTYTLSEMSDRTLDVLRTPARYRLRAGQPASGAASECRGAVGFVAGGQFAQGRVRPGRLHTLAEGPAQRLRRPQHRADFRRGLRRLPPRTRRRGGVFRRPARSGHLRQDPRRRPSRRRPVRPRAA